MPLAGGQASFDFVDVVQAGEGGHRVCRMDIDHLLDIADDRNAAAQIIDNLTQPRTEIGRASCRERV